MTVTPARTLAQRLLADGIPPSLLIDLLDPAGARLALVAELLEVEVEVDTTLARVVVQEATRSA